MEGTIFYIGSCRGMEKKMRTTIVPWGYIGIVEKSKLFQTMLAYCSAGDMLLLVRIMAVT